MSIETVFDYSTLSPEDAAHIQKCVAIAAQVVQTVAHQTVDKITLAQDLATVHCMDRPMNFFAMSLIDLNKLMYDVGLIYRTIDRRTGKLPADVQLFYQRTNPRQEFSHIDVEKHLARH